MTEIESMLLSALERLSEETKNYLQEEEERQDRVYKALNSSLDKCMAALNSENNSIGELMRMNKALEKQDVNLKEQLEAVASRLKMLETDFPKQVEQLVKQLAQQQTELSNQVEQLVKQQTQLGRQVEQLAQQQTELGKQFVRLNLS